MNGWYVRIYSFWIKNGIKDVARSAKIMPGCIMYGGEFLHIGNNTKFGRYGVLTAWKTKTGDNPSIIIGEKCNFGDYNHITAANSIVIGNCVLTGRWVTITDNSHGSFIKEHLQMPPIQRPIESKGPVVIGNNVWIGDKATILPGVHVGDGAIIAANAVVTRDVPVNSIVAGCPAIIVKRIDK